MVEINPLAWDFIAANARQYSEEVYGWLLGYFADGEPSILGAYDCQEFLEQTLISAIPEPKQFHQLAISLPNGIGVIGMYHSHPAGSNIFHSHIDDNTVLDYINLESNFVSAVTNGKDIQCFMLVDKDTKALKNVTPKLKVPPLPPSTHFRASIDLGFSEDTSEVSAPLITSKIAEIINEQWVSRRFLESVSNKSLDKKAALGKLIANPRDKSRLVDVDLPALNVKNSDQNNGEVNLRATVNVEIFHKKGDTIENVDTMVQNALRDQLTRRVFKGRLNSDTSAWELAPTNLVRFWEVPFSIIFSTEDEARECNEYLNTMLQRINYISPSILQKDPRLKLQIAQTLADLDKLAEKNDLSDQRSQINQAATNFHI